MSEMMSKTEAARFAGVTAQTFGDWVKVGKAPLPTGTVSGRSRWEREVLLEWLRAGCPVREDEEEVKP